MRTIEISPIDPARRLALCHTILTAVTETAHCARLDLACLYRDAGYRALYRLLIDAPLATARNHARDVVR